MNNSKYRFLNPYNFVRYLPEGKDNGTAEVKLLGKCPPPPHDRFVGLTGRIECKLEAKTPIFISDSEFVEGKEHRSYRFFRLIDDNGKEDFAIPSTSLRGMLRSVFEAVTNSCFSVFEGEKRLSYRDIRKARIMKPARVVALPTTNTPGRVELCNLARVSLDLLEQNDWSCGDEAYAIIKGSRVIQLSKNPLSNSKKGWLKITGRNIPNKKNEYFFYPSQKELQFDEAVMDDYNKVLQEQIAGGFSTEYQNDRLSIGDLVYVEESNGKVTNIALVKVPRLLYRNSIGDFLPEYLHPCNDYNNLCPACRVFGWVHPKPPEDLNVKVAYAGRIKITHAKIIENKGTLEEFPLAILSTPKPTSTFFYLLKNGRPDFNVKYDDDGTKLRGRKFYRHQDEANEQEYMRVGKIKDHQNRTIRDALRPGAKFEFTIEFENLAPVELGALLWTIEMEDGMFHKLGMGKPLGFGSVKISINRLEILHIKERYISFNSSGWKIVNKDTYKKWIDLFKNTMKERYNRDFMDLENIKDLKAILTSVNLPIHYPRSTKKPQQDGKNFKWFMENKKSGKMPLKLADEETEGFPLRFKKYC
ncbi:hypothetical protein JCM12298_31190 [Desulfothermus naphthae]